MRILIIEDEKDISAFLKSGLEAEHFSIDLAYDGDEGFFLATTNEYDLIILDNMLPKRSGLEVCQDIRREGKTCPILILSVISDIPSKVKLLDAGADDYLTKPFSFEELLARLRSLMRRPKKIESDVLTIADLVLDMKKCLAVRADTEIYLTKKEFMLLEYLMRNEGTVLSRAMIMEHVWDMNADPFSNTIEAHILSLRKKIDHPFAKQLIKTVPGRGYKIEDCQTQ